MGLGLKDRRHRTWGDLGRPGVKLQWADDLKLQAMHVCEYMNSHEMECSTRTHTHTLTHTHPNTQTHRYVYIHTHTYTHIYIYTPYIWQLLVHISYDNRDRELRGQDWIRDLGLHNSLAIDNNNSLQSGYMTK